MSQTDLARVGRALRRAGLDGVAVGELNGSLLLEGTLPDWADVVRAGSVAAAHRGALSPCGQPSGPARPAPC